MTKDQQTESHQAAGTRERLMGQSPVGGEAALSDAWETPPVSGVADETPTAMMAMDIPCLLTDCGIFCCWPPLNADAC